jgi:hypothetical protein
MKSGETCWFWWSACETHSVKFIKWVRMRNHCGGPDSNKIGVGALVWSDWLFRPPLMNRRQRGGLKQGFYRVRPYTILYRSNPYPGHKRPFIIRRPKLEEVK